jgi:hypothetical protein
MIGKATIRSLVQPRNFLNWTRSGPPDTQAQLLTSADMVDAMTARTVERQRPQSDPAPHAFATSLDVVAPFRATSATSWPVTPRHKQTNIAYAP